MRIFLLFYLSIGSYLIGEEIWLFASAHSTGAYGTNWRTDVSILNNSLEEAAVNVYFLQSGIDKSEENISRNPVSLNLSSKNQIKIDDILKEKFSVEQGSGALMFSSDKELLIVSRTYNQLPDKEYGQFIPGIGISKAKKEQKLIGAVSSQSFRTNIGIINPSKTEKAQISIKFSNKKGSLIKEANVELDPWVHIQYNDLFSYFGITPQEDVSIILNSSVPIFCYLSVVDNLSSDPIFIPGLL